MVVSVKLKSILINCKKDHDHLKGVTVIGGVSRNLSGNSTEVIFNKTVSASNV